jgi:hypothetical protein
MIAILSCNDDSILPPPAARRFDAVDRPPAKPRNFSFSVKTQLFKLCVLRIAAAQHYCFSMA